MQRKGRAFSIISPAWEYLKSIRQQRTAVTPSGSSSLSVDLSMYAVANVASSPSEIRRHESIIDDIKVGLSQSLASGQVSRECIDLWNSGLASELSFDYRAALETYDAALQIVPTSALLSATVARLHHRAGRCAYYLAEYQLSKKYFASLRGSCVEELGAEEQAALHGDYGCILEALGSHGLAEREFLKALGLLRDRASIYTEQYARTLNNLAQTKIQLGDLVSADSLFKQAMKTFRRTCIDISLTRAQIYNNYAEFIRRFGGDFEVKEAEKFHLAALEERIDVVGDESLAVCETYNNLAGLARQKNQPDKCIHYFQLAMRQTASLLGEFHFQLAIAKNNYGVALIDVGNYDLAVLELDSAWEIVSIGDLSKSQAAGAMRANRYAAKELRISEGANATFQNNIIFGNLVHTVTYERGRVMKESSGRMNIKKTHVGGSVVQRSNIPVPQEISDSTVVGTLEQIIEVSVVRDELRKQLEKLAEVAESSGKATNDDINLLRVASQKAASADLSGIKATLARTPFFLLKLAKEIGVSVAAKAIENAVDA